MKTTAALRPVETSNGFDNARAATIIAGPAMFKLLSGLYSHPIRAIVRELIANAIDAMAQVGKEQQPIEIGAPTYYDPTFVVQDFGPGLSEENIYRLFMGYGGTTKDADDNQIGGFGIGSKSPLCYTDTFTVVSRYAGRMATYLIFLDETRSPKTTKLDEIDYIGSTGLSVHVPLKASVDCYEFADEIRAIASLLPVLPNIPELDPPVTPQQYQIKTAQFGLRTTKQSNGHDSLRAIIGNIAYPISKYTCDLPAPQNRSYDTHRGMLDAGLDLFFSIGDLTLAPSREALVYTDEVCAKINTRLDEVINTLKSHVKAEMDTLTSEWSRYQRAHQLAQRLPISSGLFMPDNYLFYNRHSPDWWIFTRPDDLTEDLNFIGKLRRVKHKRYHQLIAPGRAMDPIPIDRIVYVNCTGVTKAAVNAAFRCATVTPETLPGNLLLFSIKADSPNKDKILNDRLKDAPVILWADLKEELRPKYPTRAAPQRQPRPPFLVASLEDGVPYPTTDNIIDSMVDNPKVPVCFRSGNKLFADPECETPLSLTADRYGGPVENLQFAIALGSKLLPNDAIANPFQILVAKKRAKVSNPTLNQWASTHLDQITRLPLYDELLHTAAILQPTNEAERRIAQTRALHCPSLRHLSEQTKALGYNDTVFAPLWEYLTEYGPVIKLITQDLLRYTPYQKLQPPETLRTDLPLYAMSDALDRAYPGLTTFLQSANENALYHSADFVADYLTLASSRYYTPNVTPQE